MTKFRVAFPTALLTGVIFSSAAFAQAPAAPTGSKPGAAPTPAPTAPARTVMAPGTATGAAPGMKPAAAPGTPAPHPAAVVTNPAGTVPPPKGGSPVLAGPGAPAAAAPAAPPMPSPNKDMEAFMKPFEGSWRCETKFAAGAMGPGSPEVTTKSSVRIKKEFGGFSWHGEYSLPKSKVMPAMSGVFQIAHEAASNGATIVGYDSMGSSFQGTGAISGDSVTFTEEGYMMGSRTKIRETMIKKGPKEITHKYEVDMGKGFQPMGEDNCKK